MKIKETAKSPFKFLGFCITMTFLIIVTVGMMIVAPIVDPKSKWPKSVKI